MGGLWSEVVRGEKRREEGERGKRSGREDP